MLNKNTCTDIFKHSMVSKGNQRIRMYEHKTNKRYFRDKMIKNNLIILQSKLKLVLGLKSLPGILYIRAMLMKIELSKQIFVLDVSDGLEVFINILIIYNYIIQKLFQKIICHLL